MARLHSKPARLKGMILPLMLSLHLAQGCGNKPSFDDLYMTVGNDNAFAPDGVGNSQDGTAGGQASSSGADLPSTGTDDPSGSNEPLSKRYVITEGRFPSDVVVQTEVTKEFGMPTLSQTFALQRTYISKNKKVQQVARPSYKDEYVQQPTGSENTDTFDQVADRALDILVVVDNSPSMKNNQKKLAARLDTLLTYVKDADWVIGVTTTDACKDCLRGLIKKTDSDAPSAYERAVTPGTHGSIVEKGVLSAVRSLQGTCLEQPWIRDDSSLAVLYVTDEDNCSDGDDCHKAPWGRGTYLTDYLKSIREPGMNARIYGLIWPPNVPANQCKTGKHQGKTYADIIKYTKGVYGSICEDDWSPTLMQISKDMKESLNTKFTLKYDPEPSSVRVFVDGTELKAGFKVQGRVVEITPAPADKAKINISYRYNVTAGKTIFKLRLPPFDNKVSVTINGMPIADTDFSYNPSLQSIEFVAPPPAGSRITISYKGDVTLNNEFVLADAIKPGSLRVTVNSAPVTSYTLDEVRGRIVFTPPPPESAFIEFSYIAVGNPIYEYPFSAPPGTPPDLNAFDADTLAPIRATYASGKVTIDPVDFVEGRRVTIVFQNGSNRTYDVVLSQSPLGDSLKAVGGQQTCLPPDLVLNGTTVNLINCRFADNVTQATVSYRYVAATYQEFVLTLARIPQPTDYQMWTVWVNDMVTVDYLRTDNVIRFPQPLPVGSIVRIQLIQEDL